MKKRIVSVALVVVMAVFTIITLFCEHDLKVENDSLKAENATLKQENTQEIEELQPCYLCGGVVKIQPVNDSFYIRCEDCELETTFFKSKSELIRYWNKD